MRHFWMLLAGALVGALAAAGGLYFNPLITASAGGGAEDFDRVLRYALPEDALVLTHGGLVPLPPVPAGVAELWERTVRAAALGTLVLDGSDGRPEAVATRIAVPSRRTDLLSRGVLIDDYWLLTEPGVGSMLVIGESNVWPLLKDIVPVTLLGRPFEGPIEHHPTAGPGSLGDALVVGATGRFAAQSGQARERYRIERVSADGGLEAMAAELQLRLDQPAAATGPQ